MRSIWVFGDQLNREIGALGRATPGRERVLLVESEGLLARDSHVQRLHLVVTAMRRFADELRNEGFEVDYRRARSLARGLQAHRDQHQPSRIVATEPNSRGARRLAERHSIELVASDQFLCHADEFASWASDRKALKLEDFYRWQRRRLGYLMDGDEPAEGRWNWDAENREPPPDDASRFVEPPRSRLDDLDRTVLDSLPDSHGAPPDGTWATTRREALERLEHFVAAVLPDFGPYEDAMLGSNWHLAHSLLSPYLNLGLLQPAETCDRVETAYGEGRVSIQSAEGFIRQVIGWREYVWGIYWLWSDHRSSNVLNHRRELPPAWLAEATSSMECLARTLAGLHDRAYVHHIQRLMVLSNFANLYGMRPERVMEWMRDNYIDGADWVMVPNVIGMALWADGGRMPTKPYVSGGAYINRMSDYCGSCRFDPKRRTGEDACPFTTLYWDFLARHRDRLEASGRMARSLWSLDRLSDLDEVRTRAEYVIRKIRSGEL